MYTSHLLNINTHKFEIYDGLDMQMDSEKKSDYSFQWGNQNDRDRNIHKEIT